MTTSVASAIASAATTPFIAKKTRKLVADYLAGLRPSATPPSAASRVSSLIAARRALAECAHQLLADDADVLVAITGLDLLMEDALDATCSDEEEGDFDVDEPVDEDAHDQLVEEVAASTQRVCAAERHEDPRVFTSKSEVVVYLHDDGTIHSHAVMQPDERASILIDGKERRESVRLNKKMTAERVAHAIAGHVACSDRFGADVRATAEAAYEEAECAFNDEAWAAAEAAEEAEREADEPMYEAINEAMPLAIAAAQAVVDAADSDEDVDTIETRAKAKGIEVLLAAVADFDEGPQDGDIDVYEDEIVSALSWAA